MRTPVRTPTEPHPVNPSSPRPHPGPPRPTTPVPPPGLADNAALRMAIALLAVGVLLLTTHYFAPVILLAALPTREWRAAA